MRRGVEDAPGGRERQTVDSDHWQTGGSGFPIGATDGPHSNTEVGGDVEIAQLRVISDAGNGHVAEVVADITPGGFARRGIVGHIEDVAGRGWRVGVVAGERDEGVVGIRGVYRDATDE